MRLVRPVVAAALLVVVLGACSDDETATPTTDTVQVTTSARGTSVAPTTKAPITTASTSSTSSTVPPPTTVAYDPGEACTLGTNPDCIDPNGTGEGVFLIGGADCMAAAARNGSGTAICVDLDRDGRAGYPDRG